MSGPTAVLLLALVLARGPGQVDFDTEVLPLLTSAGCNAAACHGAFGGRGGFQLSLFGANPAADHASIVFQYEGRRVNLADPASSLLLLKPSGFVDHAGDLRLPDDGDGYRLVTLWIQQGARRQAARQLAKLRVEPGELLVPAVPATVEFRVRADFTDGTHRDVTPVAVVNSTDETSVAVGRPGQVTLLRRGQHVVLVRYLSAIRTVRLVAPLGEQPLAEPAAEGSNWIDEVIDERRRVLRLPASPPARPEQLLRRVTLDLTGRLPTPAEYAAYLSDAEPRRYERLVERLLQSDAFTQYWTFRLCRWLRVRSQPQDSAGVEAFAEWVRRQVAGPFSWPQMVAELVAADGDSHVHGPANFHRFTGNPRDQAEYVSEVLMGVRLRCANCHDHPLDRWTQDDYHGLAAIFARLERGRVVREAPRGEVIHPLTETPARPRIPGEDFLDGFEGGRRALAGWLTAERNPYLARALVNRLWRAMLGRGLVEPVDDLRETNPATHPELLGRLADDFLRHGGDVRRTLRQIALSAAYQRSGRPLPENAADDRFYSHALEVPLEAEVLADAIADVTGVALELPGQPAGTRAVALLDGRLTAPSLDVLGRCAAGESCESATAAGGLAQRLHLLNGPLVNQPVIAQNGHLQTWLRQGRSTRQIIQDLYQRALCREPAAGELDFWLSRIPGEAGDGDAADDPRAPLLEDFLWSLLNSREFVTRN
ncbi:MAG: DUF1553 domain-containing protein [Pirellulaceae bacterium]|nr:DUF1553 domain-containing protein [Pirellulaceae bacterium]